MGCRLWGHTESDTTDVTQQHKLVKILNIGQFAQNVKSLFFVVK